MRIRIVPALLMGMFLLAVAVPVTASEWSVEQYPVGKEVSYRPGETYHLEFVPVCRNAKVDEVAQGRLPVQYHEDLVDVVLKQRAATIAHGNRWINLTLRDVDPNVAPMLPVLGFNEANGEETVIGHITPNFQDGSTVRYDGIPLDGVKVIVTPVELWSGKNPGLELRADFPLYHNSAGERTLETKKGFLADFLQRKEPAITFWLITDCS